MTAALVKLIALIAIEDFEASVGQRMLQRLEAGSSTFFIGCATQNFKQSSRSLPC